MKCWICGAPADSAEHKIKKSLLVELHGKKYGRSNPTVHIKDGEVRELQGPGSELVTFPRCLCSSCNNHKSQPFDRAYDTFFRYVLRNRAQLVERRVIDFADVYGIADFQREQTNLYKYFVKLFGCDLSAHGLPVPAELSALLDQARFMTKLRFSFSINEDKLMLGEKWNGSTGLGDLVFRPADAGVADPRAYAWSIHFSFLHIFFWYAMAPSGPLGSMWAADDRWAYLGWLRPLSSEERAELKASVTDQNATENSSEE